MPTYDYHCAANDAVVEVSHRMSEVLHTWGELCEKAGIESGDTPLDTPVTRLATGGVPVKSANLKNTVPPCVSSGTCAGKCGIS